MMRCSQVFGLGTSSRRTAVRALVSLTLTAAILSGSALQAQNRRNRQGNSEMDQDFPFQTACIGTQFPADNVAFKGVAIKLGNDAFVCFDTDQLRMTAGWTGNYLH